MDAPIVINAMTTLEVQPAYGRKYENREEILQDWQAGKDFQIFRGPYFSIRDLNRLRTMGYEKIFIASTTRLHSPLYVEITIQ